MATLGQNTNLVSVITNMQREIAELKRRALVYNEGTGGVSGPAGGHLTGTYPNPSIATGVITNSHINASADISMSKINGLVTALADKSNVGHTHAIADVTGLDPALGSWKGQDTRSANFTLTATQAGRLQRMTTSNHFTIPGGIASSYNNMQFHLMAQNTGSQILTGATVVVNGVTNPTYNMKQFVLYSFTRITTNTFLMTETANHELVEKLANSGIGVVTHGSDNSVARPTGYKQVYWIGSVEPINADPNDPWQNTTPQPSPYDRANHYGSPSANVNMGNKRITNLAPAVAGADGTNYDQLLSGIVAAQEGFSIKQSVRANTIKPLSAHTRTGDTLEANSNGPIAPYFGNTQYISSLIRGGAYLRKSAIASDGSVYVVDSTNHKVLKFGADGNYISSFGSYGTANGQFQNPMDVALDSSDRIYVIDYGLPSETIPTAGRVQRFNTNHTYQSTFIPTGTDGATGKSASGWVVEIDSANNVYIIDGVLGIRVQKFNSSGTFQWSKGTGGSGDGNFAFAQGLAFEGTTNVFVSDTLNNRIQKINASNGNYISKFTPASQTGGTGNPRDIAFNTLDNTEIYIALRDRVVKYSTSGTYLDEFGARGSGNGKMSDISGITVEKVTGNIYVSDSNIVQKYKPYSLYNGDSVLVKNEGTNNIGAHNGIYEIDSVGGSSSKWKLTRRSDSVDGLVVNGNMVISQLDADSSSSVFLLTTGDPITVNTTPVEWKRFEPGGPPTAHAASHLPNGEDPIDIPPSGSILAFAGTTTPAGYLACDGSSKNVVDYPTLFGAIGYSFGGSGATFNVPDLRGRVGIGVDGGAGRVATNNALAQSSGAETHTLNINQVPSHGHNQGTLTTGSAGEHGHVMGYNTAANTVATGGQQRVTSLAFSGYSNSAATQNAGSHTHTISGSTGTSGGGLAHNNMQPYLVLNYIIKV